MEVLLHKYMLNNSKLDLNFQAYLLGHVSKAAEADCAVLGDSVMSMTVLIVLTQSKLCTM